MRLRIFRTAKRVKRLRTRSNLGYLADKIINTNTLNQLQLLKQSIFFHRYFLGRARDFNRVKLQRKRCLYTSRARAVLSLTRNTRHVFKRMALDGALYGVYKASW